MKYIKKGYVLENKYKNEIY